MPLRQALRQKKYLTPKERDDLPVIHVCFLTSQQCFVGYSLPETHAPYPMGVLRLKMVKDAPSRSTLKFDEAFHVFIPEEEREQR